MAKAPSTNFSDENDGGRDDSVVGQQWLFQFWTELFMILSPLGSISWKILFFLIPCLLPSKIFSFTWPHLFMSNAITLDLDITNKYITGEKKNLKCQVPILLTCISPAPPLSPPSVPAIIQPSGEKWMVFHSHHLTFSFLTFPSLDSMNDHYNYNELLSVFSI